MSTQAPDRPLTGEGVQIRLLRTGQDVEEISLAQLSRLKRRPDSLVWIDGNVSDTGTPALLGALRILHDDPRSLVPLLQTTSEPGVEDRDDLVRVEVIGLDADRDFRPRDVICIAGKDWVATTHATDVQFVEDFSEALEGPNEAGALDSAAFLAVLLEWQMESYRLAVDDVMDRIDGLDDELLTPGWREEKLITPMVQIRRRISHLRRLLTPHRQVYRRLASPALDQLSTSESAESFESLVDETDEVAASVENAREMLLGSFAFLSAQAAERTNNVMQTLTFVSIVLLPSTVIAGVLGMNFKVGLFNHAYLFWVTVAFILALLLGGLVFARQRGLLGLRSAFDAEVPRKNPRR